MRTSTVFRMQSTRSRHDRNKKGDLSSTLHARHPNASRIITWSWSNEGRATGEGISRRSGDNQCR